MGRTVILGGGVAGLAAGMVSGFPVYEASGMPGGICASYYVRPGTKEPLPSPPEDGQAYRFEIGGGHWIFGGDPAVLRFVQSLAPGRRYVRRSSVYFAESGLYVPFPIQNNLRYLGKDVAARVLSEMSSASNRTSRTMAGWLRNAFGETLYNAFVYPFNFRYTDGLIDEIAPQDAYKSPVNLALAIRGAFADTDAVGYNTTYFYPDEGLNALARRMATRCDIHYGKRVVEIQPDQRRLLFADGSVEGYEELISTLPLNRVVEMARLEVEGKLPPYTSVLVLNVGASRGPRCPDEHWLYIPHSRAGFHRVGFYSNVNPGFLPASSRNAADRVSVYVERAYRGDRERPSESEITSYAQAVVQELGEWEFIERAEVVDPTWIDVAYTWSWPGSDWEQRATEALRSRGIHQTGRYGRWRFQGIADSILDGFVIGSALSAGHRQPGSLASNT